MAAVPLLSKHWPLDATTPPLLLLCNDVDIADDGTYEPAVECKPTNTPVGVTVDSDDEVETPPLHDAFADAAAAI